MLSQHRGAPDAGEALVGGGGGGSGNCSANGGGGGSDHFAAGSDGFWGRKVYGCHRRGPGVASHFIFSDVPFYFGRAGGTAPDRVSPPGMVEQAALRAIHRHGGRRMDFRGPSVGGMVVQGPVSCWFLVAGLWSRVSGREGFAGRNACFVIPPPGWVSSEGSWSALCGTSRSVTV